jgi:hypothetical protein
VANGSPYTTTYSPFTIAAQPTSSNGEFVYSFSINDAGDGYNAIEGFELDPTTGVLKTITGSPFINLATGHWGQFDQSGANLVAYSSIFDPNTGTTTTQLGPLEVGPTGALTQPITPSLTIKTPGYWVVTDP